jgi:tetratricopeptide (TPR) repeat protein
MALLAVGLPTQALAQQPAEESGEPAPAEGQDTPPTKAEDSSAYDALISLAQEHFAKKEYGEALAALERAYALNPNPNLIYNQARIYEAMGELEKALELYEKFAVAPDIDLDYRRETLERIKVLKEAVALKNDSKPNESDQNPQLVVAQPTQPTNPPRRSPIGGILLATGGVSLAAGGVFAGLAVSNHNKFEASTELNEKRSFGERVDTFAPTADGLFLAGGLLVTGGLIALAVTRNRTEAPRALRLAPSVNRAGAGAMLDLTF